MEQIVTMDQQIVQKVVRLDPIQKQTVSSFIDFLLSRQVESPSARKSALLEISVWDDQAIAAIQDAEQKINAWTLPTF